MCHQVLYSLYHEWVNSTMYFTVVSKYGEKKRNCIGWFPTSGLQQTMHSCIVRIDASPIVC